MLAPAPEPATGRPAGEAPPSSPPGLLVAALLVTLAAWLAYSNSFSVPFQFDDGMNIVENPRVRDLTTFLSMPREPRRWLTMLTFALNGSLGGLSVTGYHALNFAIHVAASLLVWLLARLILSLAAPDATPRSRELGPLAAALVFALHPIQTQAVTYVVQRLASLTTLLFVGAVLLHGLAVTARSRRAALALRASSLVLATLSLFAKENAVVVPLAIALFDWAFLPGTVRERLARLAPTFVVTAAVASLLLDPGPIMGAVRRDFEVAAGVSALPPWAAYLLTQPTALLTYLRLLVLPIAQNLDYDVPVVTSVLAASTLAPLALLAALLGLPAAIAWRRRAASPLARLLLFAIGWFLLTLAVESSVIALPDVVNEHRMYLPLAGIAASMGVALAHWLSRPGAAEARGRAAAVALATACVAMGAATWSRNRVWADPMTLWSDVVAKSPGKARGHIWIARTLAARGDLGSAIAVLEAARGLPTGTAPLFANLGAYYGQVGRTAEAEEAFRKALSMRGGERAEPHLGLGQLLLDRRDVDAACTHFRAAVELSPDNATARANVAACRQRTGDLRGAIDEWREILRLDPANVPAMFNLARALATAGELGAAAEAYRRFLSFPDPRYAVQRALAEQWLTLNTGTPSHGAPHAGE